MTSGVGVAATKIDKVAMIEAKAVSRMFSILTLSLLHASFILFPYTHCNSIEGDWTRSSDDAQ